MTATFTDRASPPSREASLASLGPARDLWVRLEEFARLAYGLEGEPVFAGRDSGWSVRYRRSGKALFTLIPRRGGFTALVVVGPSAWAGAAGLELGEKTKEAWEAARAYPDGRWLWLDVANEAVAADIERLVSLKSPPTARRRQALGV